MCSKVRKTIICYFIISKLKGCLEGMSVRYICRELVLGRNNVHQLTAFNLCIFSGIHTRSIIMDLLGRSDKIY